VEMTQSMNEVIHHYHFLIVTVQIIIEYRTNKFCRELSLMTARSAAPSLYNRLLHYDLVEMLADFTSLCKVCAAASNRE
jgi:hypothetical protein